MDEESKEEFEKMLSLSKAKYEKLVKEEEFYQEYIVANEDPTSFTRGIDSFIF